MQEDIAEGLIKIAWHSIGGDANDLEINKAKINIPIQIDYLDRIKEPLVRQHIENNIDNYVYKLSVDKHVFINGGFVIGIECKAFTENAMIKRILIDFDLLKTRYSGLSCYLFQLESQLGGDYSQLTKPTYNSHSTHTIQSYFNCDLNIITLLSGERNINKPIHKHFKPLTMDCLRDAMQVLANDMQRFL